LPVANLIRSFDLRGPHGTNLTNVIILSAQQHKSLDFSLKRRKGLSGIISYGHPYWENQQKHL
jgi:hypothetical protein